ncbi:hypothetical protein [Arenimonas donghaensis]|uniref:Uncharacterized protein n=1 Tax=Arenimonas donghaensis DSM 18148 = HO3-R19 TaxID=1121014 RepID=A0A087MI34_9GAMM|nr:hypothetical protein [Arenimonas donghaensis]KFL36537.1 hypothetical protein N788_12555 [Arenimonas donghaensis DSM 18148 = HO3-R19]
MTEKSAHPAPVNHLSGRTTPTWEIELLLSGATVFALVQFAGALPEWGGYLLPRLGPLWQQVLGLGLVYFQCGVILLCVAFVLHLFMRAYWVALVGMDSVYPGGLKPDRLRGGPVGRDLLLSRWVPMPEQIEAADNRASVVFGMGIGLARMMVTITFVGSALLLVSLGLAALAGQADQASTWVMYVFSLSLFPYLLVLMADRYLGHRLSPGGWPYRAIRGVLAAFSRFGLGRESAPLVTLYTTNVGEDRGNWIVGGIVTFATVASIASMNVLDDDLGWGHYDAFPTLESSGEQSVRHDRYASLHEVGESPQGPYVPDMVARGSYLPLVVPFVPSVHGHLLENCTERQAADADAAAREAQREARRDCLSAGLAVSLDGEPLDLRAELYSDARRDLRGLLYMVPLSGQRRGRHELNIVLTPQTPPKKGELPPTWRIPYWY